MAAQSTIGEPRLGITAESGCWPTYLQELLLKAAVLKGTPAMDAWRKWRKEADLDAVDFGSHRMLPQLYRNLLDHGVSDPLLPKLRGVYRYYWCKNELLLVRGAAALAAFRAANIEVIALKGSALIVSYYGDSGLRPLQDLDFLVPAPKANQAISLLQSLGWQSIFGKAPERLFVQHSTPFRNAERQQLDLHWHVLGNCWNWTRDERFWDRSVSVALGGQTVRALDATDQLFHVCAHGVQWNEVPPIRWIADAMIILTRARQPIDWERLTQMAALHHLTLPIFEALSYLRKTFQAPVPERVTENMRRVPLTDIDRFGYRISTQPSEDPTTGEIVRRLAYECLQVTSTWPLMKRPRIAMKWLQFRWSAGTPWQLMTILSSRVARHARKQATLSREPVYATLNGDGSRGIQHGD